MRLYETCCCDIIVLSFSYFFFFLVTKKNRVNDNISLGSISALDYVPYERLALTFIILLYINNTIVAIISINVVIIKRGKVAEKERERLQFESQRYRKAIREKRANFVARFFFILSLFLLRMTRFSRLTEKKRKRRRAIGTVYAFSCTTRPPLYYLCICVY